MSRVCLAKSARRSATDCVKGSIAPCGGGGRLGPALPFRRRGAARRGGRRVGGRALGDGGGLWQEEGVHSQGRLSSGKFGDPTDCYRRCVGRSRELSGRLSVRLSDRGGAAAAATSTSPAVPSPCRRFGALALTSLVYPAALRCAGSVRRPTAHQHAPLWLCLCRL